MPQDIRCERLLVLTHLYAPDLCGGARIFTDMCRGLASRGVEVTVRCAYPHYPEWTDKTGRNGWRVERYEEQGVKVERYGSRIPSDPTSVSQRLFFEGSYLASLGRSLLSGASRFDAVMAFCPMAGTVAVAAMLRLLSRKPLWLNVQDLPADAAAAGGMARARVVRGLLRYSQSLLFNRADVWSSISPVMIDRLKNLRLGGQPIVLLPNWLHDSISEEIRRLPSKLSRGPRSPVQLLYAGNIGTKQGLLDFCEVLRESDSAFSFRIQGEGGVAGQVRDWVSSVADSRFTFGPLMEEPAFVRALHETDFFVVTEKSGSGASFFPSKMVPCMASGTPSLVVCDPESPLGHEASLGSFGPWFDWENVGEAPGLLDSMQGRGEEFRAWQRAALQRSLVNDRERCLDLIERTLGELVVDRTLSRSKARTAVTPDVPQVVFF